MVSYESLRRLDGLLDVLHSLCRVKVNLHIFKYVVVPLLVVLLYNNAFVFEHLHYYSLSKFDSFLIIPLAKFCC